MTQKFSNFQDYKKISLSLNHASLMLDRLRNTGYTPKQYNELFMTITNELRHLDIFIDDLFSRDHMVRNFKLLSNFFRKSNWTISYY